MLIPTVSLPIQHKIDQSCGLMLQQHACLSASSDEVIKRMCGKCRILCGRQSSLVQRARFLADTSAA
ncbi:unnamed protein product [Protopolystoma xenopodis]|uniref:Uncharacterized protein n=1 Tax=Protopolystoma xenopodis TaxID=117903 RepID=A0A3S5BRL9_9PLAT|nr:unnamed protein product [Protopolystoma xenopodis]